jgi:phosphoglycerol transferase MdoB-like AlkP superfamily enzyme
MNSFFDSLPSGAVGIITSVVFFLIFVAAAYIVFRLLRKTVKMAFRLTIVAVILLIAIVGSVSFYWLGHSKPTRAERPRPTQSK